MKVKFFAQTLVLLTALCLPGQVWSQVSACTQSEVDNPPRTVFTCAGGLIIEAEAAAKLGIETDAKETRPSGIQLSDKAVLIEVTPGNGPFQIETPHAIAAVRGTIYIVDAEAGSTSVFVVRGKVAVSRPDGADTVLLLPGEGTSVEAGEPIEKNVWPQDKVTQFLARFGR